MQKSQYDKNAAGSKEVAFQEFATIRARLSLAIERIGDTNDLASWSCKVAYEANDALQNNPLIKAAPEMLDVLEEYDLLITKIMHLAQTHDKTTGFYKDVSPYDILELFSNSKIPLNATELIKRAKGE